MRTALALAMNEGKDMSYKHLETVIERLPERGGTEPLICPLRY